ncbi:hypothetical protein [Larsenimonas suaedae]|uniref:Uncharacterized protein n=1 Tax=Larsenimonas suaedae TaxID=1851019 RepID=A0ABU1H0H2_9GAMM|nr:hypothetical protein [Larsenimonas suaedae]MCM2973734.1 hypothetical protein [Larsenimonas suaedae]MDR5897257.1 hypothetical protein [Larsenimonas suaedae]
MQLDDIFDALGSSELSQLSLGSETDMGVARESEVKLLPHINLGLTALHKRFKLREGRIRVLRKPGREQYVLTAAHAMSAQGVGSRDAYIDDAERTFENDLLKIEQVLDPNGCPVPLNDENMPGGLRTLSVNTLVMPATFAHPYVTVVYRANHPQLKPTNATAIRKMEIDLPFSHLEALLFFIASRVFNPMGASEGFHEGNNYASKYERACLALENGGYQLENQFEDHRFHRNGWC